MSYIKNFLHDAMNNLTIVALLVTPPVMTCGAVDAFFGFC